jgi:dihydropteroate synthase
VALSSIPVLRGFPGLGRTRVMGVVNVTPDSFSDGGAHADPDSAVRHGLRLLNDGADLLDVGGESTRPGAERVSEPEELRRVLPVVEGLSAAGAIVSIDTTRASVAAAALGAGAQLVNDVSGGLADPDMLPTVVEAAVPYVAMHWRGHSQDMQSRARYDDVVAEVCAELEARRDAALSAGMDPQRLLLDPGFGFAKDAAHAWALLRALPRLADLGAPLLIGASRKAFLGALLADADGAPRPAADRDDATAALTVLAAQAGAWAVRVHEARASADAVRVVAAVGA